MKKFLIILLVLLPFMFVSCSDNSEETTEAETQTQAEETTIKSATLEEMSPETMDVSLPEGIEVYTYMIPFSSFESIDAEDSVFPESGYEKILKGENAQYFFSENDEKAHAIFFDENGIIIASASYNMEKGCIEFYGNEADSWYFNEDGTLKCVVHAYAIGTGYAPIYTFYTPEGGRDVVRTVKGWYSDDLDKLTDEEVFEYLKKYDGVPESTASY